MTGLVVTGGGALCARGIGFAPIAAAIARAGVAEGHPSSDSREPSTEPFPSGGGHPLADFDARRLLGRKGTAFLDRRSALALVASGQALQDSGLSIDETNANRVGVTLGTTWGSLKSMSDYTRESLLADRPYLVTPANFPNTVMNCAAGQTAIRYGLKGVNATIAGGALAFLQVLAYVANALRCGHADAMLAGAVEECTAHMAWAVHRMEPHGRIDAGEGAAVFVVERSEDARGSGRHIDLELKSVTTSFSPAAGRSGRLSGALADCIRRGLAKSDVRAEQVSFAVTSQSGEDDRDRIETEALSMVFGNAQPERLLIKKIMGECLAATGGLQLAGLLVLHRRDPSRDGRISLFTGWTADGGVGAAIVRGWSRVSSDSG